MPFTLNLAYKSYKNPQMDEGLVGLGIWVDVFAGVGLPLFVGYELNNHFADFGVRFAYNVVVEALPHLPNALRAVRDKVGRPKASASTLAL